MLGSWFSQMLGGSNNRAKKSPRAAQVTSLLSPPLALRAVGIPADVDCADDNRREPGVPRGDRQCAIIYNQRQQLPKRLHGDVGGRRGRSSFPNLTISSQSSTQIVIDPNFGTAQDVWSVEVINPGSIDSSQFYFPTTPSGLPQPDAFGVDYSFARPAPSSLKSAGSTFAVRYVRLFWKFQEYQS